MAKLPYIQFYTGDWLRDTAVRACSVAARGLWIDMICVMSECPRRGFLQHKTGDDWTTAQLARLAGCSVVDVEGLLEELGAAGVFARTAEGVIYCPRIVKDEEFRRRCGDAGRRGGGNPNLYRSGQRSPKPTPKASEVQSSEINPESFSASAREKPPPVSAGTIAEIYAAYPRKVGRAAALKAIEKAIRSGKDPGFLLDRVRQYAASPLVLSTEPEFIPHPSTWFNEARYDDDTAEWQRSRSAGSGPKGQDADARRAAKARTEFPSSIRLPVC